MFTIQILNTEEEQPWGRALNKNAVTLFKMQWCQRKTDCRTKNGRKGNKISCVFILLSVIGRYCLKRRLHEVTCMTATPKFAASLHSYKPLWFIPFSRIFPKCQMPHLDLYSSNTWVLWQKYLNLQTSAAQQALSLWLFCPHRECDYKNCITNENVHKKL